MSKNRTSRSDDLNRELYTGGTAFLVALEEAWEDKEAVERVAAAWGVQQNEIEAWHSLGENNAITEEEVWYRTVITSYMTCEFMMKAGRPDSEPILQASQDELVEWEDEYQRDLRRLIDLMGAREEQLGKRASRADLQIRHRDWLWNWMHSSLHRRCWLLWQVQKRLEMR